MKPDDTLFAIVKRMTEIETEYLARSWPAVPVYGLQDEAVGAVKEFFHDYRLSI